jgi:hypothetical protein
MQTTTQPVTTTFGGISLQGDASEFRSGACFELDPAPRDNRILVVSDGWEVELRSGLRYAVARTGTGLPRSEALDGALDAVQQALDLLCVAEHQRILVSNHEREHLVWYVQQGTKVLRALTVSGLGMGMKVTASITRADGTVEEPDLNPVPAWHECFRYYRLAQVSEDPFDAFRNLWLSLELAFSIKSAKGSEGEVVWIRRLAAMLHTSLPTTAWPTNGADQVDDLVADFYKDTRCRLFHAKDGKPRLSPHVAADRRLVVDRFAALQPFVREVLAEVAGAPRGGGVITHAGFRQVQEQAHGDGLILLSDSADQLVPEESNDSPCWSGAKVVPGPRMSQESRGGLELRGARYKVQSLMPVSICRIGLSSKSSDGTPDILFTSSLRGATLTIREDFDEFEPVCGIELVNQSSPRVRFKL